MTLTIGRFGLDVTANGPSAFQLSGDQLNISGPLRVSSVADMKTLRQQLNGYVDNPWEKVVPVTWSTDASIDGFYRVTGVAIDVPTFGYRNGFASFSCSLERVKGYASAIAESVLTGTSRTGKPGGVTASTWLAVPTTALAFAAAGAAPGAGRAGPGGTAWVYTDATVYYSARPTFIIPPASWYDMATTIKLDSKVAVGRQIGGDYSTGWELSNGLVKMTGGTGGPPLHATAWAMSGPAYATSTSSYGASKVVQPATNSAGSMAAFGGNPTMTILRNCPEESIIRLTYGAASTPARTQVDLGLRRGACFFTVTIASLDSLKYGIKAGTTVTTALASGGGYKEAANDGNGNRIVICAGATGAIPATSQDGYALSVAGTFFDGMVGFEVGGSSASAPDRATDMRDQFMAAITETQSVRLQ